MEDLDSVIGSDVSLEKLKGDLQMMKMHNINALYSDRYLNIPYFYQLCDEYGFYVMDDLVYSVKETHKGLLEYKNAYRPVKVLSYEQKNQIIILKNCLDFTNQRKGIYKNKLSFGKSYRIGSCWPYAWI